MVSYQVGFDVHDVAGDCTNLMYVHIAMVNNQKAIILAVFTTRPKNYYCCLSVYAAMLLSTKPGVYLGTNQLVSSAMGNGYTVILNSNHLPNKV